VTIDNQYFYSFATRSGAEKANENPSVTMGSPEESICVIVSEPEGFNKIGACLSPTWSFLFSQSLKEHFANLNYHINIIDTSHHDHGSR
jgi:hypothetical protein